MDNIPKEWFVTTVEQKRLDKAPKANLRLWLPPAAVHFQIPTSWAVKRGKIDKCVNDGHLEHWKGVGWVQLPTSAYDTVEKRKCLALNLWNAYVRDVPSLITFWAHQGSVEEFFAGRLKYAAEVRLTPAVRSAPRRRRVTVQDDNASSSDEYEAQGGEHSEPGVAREESAVAHVKQEGQEQAAGTQQQHPVERGESAAGPSSSKRRRTAAVEEHAAVEVFLGGHAGASSAPAPAPGVEELVVGSIEDLVKSSSRAKEDSAAAAARLAALEQKQRCFEADAGMALEQFEGLVRRCHRLRAEKAEAAARVERCRRQEGAVQAVFARVWAALEAGHGGAAEAEAGASAGGGAGAGAGGGGGATPMEEEGAASALVDLMAGAGPR